MVREVFNFPVPSISQLQSLLLTSRTKSNLYRKNGVGGVVQEFGSLVLHTQDFPELKIFKKGIFLEFIQNRPHTSAPKPHLPCNQASRKDLCQAGFLIRCGDMVQIWIGKLEQNPCSPEVCGCSSCLCEKLPKAVISRSVFEIKNYHTKIFCCLSSWNRKESNVSVVYRYLMASGA